MVTLNRDQGGRFLKGTSGNPNGRLKRADEMFLVNLWEEVGQRQFSDAVKLGERWALKTLVDKLYPNMKPAEVDAVAALPKPVLLNFDPAFKERLKGELRPLVIR